MKRDPPNYRCALDFDGIAIALTRERAATPAGSNEVAGMKIENAEKAQAVSAEQTARRAPPPPQAEAARTEISGIAQEMEKLKSLQQTDQSKFKEVMSQVAQSLQQVAKTQSPQQGQVETNRIAEAFAASAKSGELPQLERNSAPPPKSSAAPPAEASQQQASRIPGAQSAEATERPTAPSGATADSTKFDGAARKAAETYSGQAPMGVRYIEKAVSSALSSVNA